MGHGLLCYSDDSAVLDQDFRVCGMPFPVMVRQESWPLMEACMPGFSQRAPAQERWGATVRFLPSNLPRNASPSARAQALVFVEYRPGSKAHLEALSPFEALMGLQQGGFWVEHTEAGIAAFLDWLGGLDCRRLTYSRIEEARQAIGALLARTGSGAGA
jgi:hypothetical protein